MGNQPIRIEGTDHYQLGQDTNRAMRPIDKTGYMPNEVVEVLVGIKT